MASRSEDWFFGGDMIDRSLSICILSSVVSVWVDSGILSGWRSLIVFKCAYPTWRAAPLSPTENRAGQQRLMSIRKWMKVKEKWLRNSWYESSRKKRKENPRVSWITRNMIRMRHLCANQAKNAEMSHSRHLGHDPLCMSLVQMTSRMASYSWIWGGEIAKAPTTCVKCYAVLLVHPRASLTPWEWPPCPDDSAGRAATHLVHIGLAYKLFTACTGYTHFVGRS